ncbi:YdcF family protein [Rhizobium sp. TH2]|uniref:YdcF family protein n=1 Tax=Rhizobium sp. TH2 TaxID=2775403 RepID=UPI002158988D|nr:YdcF family protein [Rhizobium sp. TH2]UVC09533.1 YdcF family protein [Rhizobium sp. TH2]
MFMTGKLLWIVVQPLTLALIVKVLAFLMLIIGRRKLAGFLSLLAGTILFVTLFTTTGAWSLQTLEARYARPALPTDVACMIVLGGGFDLEVTAGRGGMEMNQAADRYIEAARLARLYPVAKILVSGGDGSFSGTYKGDAELSAKFFQSMGVDPARIIMEKTSRNTIENVAETKTLLDANKLSDCLLITSAYHMPRAKALFDAEGVMTIPWPTDYRANGKVEFGLDFTQPSLNAALTSTAMREWAALLNAYLQGKSETLVP